MITTLLTTGIACLLAAIVGGGLKALGFEIPILQSGKRRALLAGLGVILLIAASMARPHWEMSALEVGIDRFGGNDYNEGAPAESANACSHTCLIDSRCMAFSFNVTSKQCWLKGDVPLRRDNRSFTSGVKQVTPWWKMW
jgi:hypothetical protein